MFVEGLRWRLPTEGLSGPAVERGGNSLDLFGGPAREVGAFGEVLAQQAVGVLVRPALPGAVRVGEVDRDAGLDPEHGVGGQFLSSVPGQRSAQLLWKRAHRCRE